MDNTRASRLVPAFVVALLGGPLTTLAYADDVSQQRSVSGFERIRLQGAFTTDISAGAASTRLVVSGNPNAVARVTAEVRDGTLVVGIRGNGSLRRAPKLTIALPVLRSFANDGAGKVNIVGLSGRGDFEITNSGAASIVAAGRAARERITLEGTGKIDATAVDARDVSVESNGVGSVLVRASGLLSMNLNGVGEIRYAGNPSHVESHVNGIGRIGRL